MKKQIKIFLIFIILIIVDLNGCIEDESNKKESSNDLPMDESDMSEGFSQPQIENIGLEIDFFYNETNKAGDFEFDTFVYPRGQEIYNHKIFYDYGDMSTDDNGTVKLEPQPMFIAPLGTKIHAITSGVVSSISTLYSNDYTIHVIKPQNPKWTYEHEHVINVTVEIGDKVIAGQIIAEISDYNQWLKNDGYGVFDIGILTTENGMPVHHCPFMYLNESVKQDYFEKINALYESWERYTDNSSLYNEDEYAIPGCITLDPIYR